MYDLIIRDGTIVSSAGRLVADVAVKNGKIAYVGPRPPRSAKRELSAIGKFLMPGLIDTGAILTDSDDPDGWSVETRAAVTGGVTTVLALPGPSPISTAAQAKKRAKAYAKSAWCNYGLWVQALPGDTAAAEAAAKVPSVVAALAELGQGDFDEATLQALAAIEGVLGVRYLGEPDDVRPNAEGIPDQSPEALAVMKLVRDQGHSVHWSHLSTAAELDLLDPVRGDLPVTSAVSPHHLFLSLEEDEGVKLTPALRPEQDRRTLWTAIKRGRLDCLASDHRTSERAGEGAPSAEVTFALMLSSVRMGRLSLEQLATMCAEAPARVFGLENKGKIKRGADADLLLFSEDAIAQIEESTLLSGAGWSPYGGREAAPKPDLVMVRGQTTAVRGELVADAPNGAALGD